MANEIVMIDKTDRTILNILQENSRLSFRKIASRAGISVATVINRVNRLQKEGVIRNYSVKIDYEKLDYDVEALVEIKISRSKGNPYDADPFILNHPNVHSIYNVSGNVDHILLVKFQNRRQLNEFLRKINSLPSIDSSQTRFILKNFKEDQVKV